MGQWTHRNLLLGPLGDLQSLGGRLPLLLGGRRRCWGWRCLFGCAFFIWQLRWWLLGLTPSFAAATTASSCLFVRHTGRHAENQSRDGALVYSPETQNSWALVFRKGPKCENQSQNQNAKVSLKVTLHS